MKREEAIADIKHSVNWAKENDERWCDSIEVGSLELALEALKQPEQKKGKWIERPIAGCATVRCSVCTELFGKIEVDGIFVQIAEQRWREKNNGRCCEYTNYQFYYSGFCLGYMCLIKQYQR